MSKVKEKLREKILKIKGGEFKEWYDSLGEVSKKIYKKVREEMDYEYTNKKIKNETTIHIQSYS